MVDDIAIDEILTALSSAKSVALKPGEVLFREDDDGRSMYIVKRGVLRVLSGSTLFETVRESGIVGEMAIVEEGKPRSATVIASTFCELVEIDVSRFLALVASNPSFSITVMRILSRRLRVMDRRYRNGDAHP